jgi:hypothetical protein
MRRIRTNARSIDVDEARVACGAWFAAEESAAWANAAKVN